MCWAIMNAASGILPADPTVESFVGETVGSGRGTFGIHKARGRIVATPMRFGMIPPGAMGRREMFWNARAEKIDKITIWTRLHRQRCVVPISAYCENRPAETWLKGPDAYLVGLYDTHPRDGGMVAVTETDGTTDGRRPLVTDEAGAIAWLEANHWDVVETIVSMTRVTYEELDLFESKRLSVDVRGQARARGRKAA